jgi:hypothetical protein
LISDFPAGDGKNDTLFSQWGPRPKTTILLFPRSVDDMIQLSDNMQNPAWSGLRILQSMSKFFPKIPEWKDPICPLLLLGSFFNEAPNVPNHQEMQFHIAAVMKSAGLPITPAPAGRAFRSSGTRLAPQ